MLEMNAIVFPSGDQVVPPTARVMYSFSMVRFFSTCALGLLEICLGSVTTCGTGRACGRTLVAITTTITKSRKARMRPRFGTQCDEKAEFSTRRGCPILRAVFARRVGILIPCELRAWCPILFWVRDPGHRFGSAVKVGEVRRSKTPP